MKNCDIKECPYQDSSKMYDEGIKRGELYGLNALKDIREEIGGLQTYKLFIGDTELYLSKDDVKAILDKKIAELEGKE